MADTAVLEQPAADAEKSPDQELQESYPVSFVNHRMLPDFIDRVRKNLLEGNIRPLSDIVATDCLINVSSDNLARLRSDVLSSGPLTADEQKLFEQIDRFPPRIIHRASFDDFVKILNDGAILTVSQVASKEKDFRPFTPAIEDTLFQAHRNVFTSVGPPFGRSRYGEIIIEINPREPDQWATEHSGWYYMTRVQGVPRDDFDTADQIKGLNMMRFQRGFEQCLYAQRDWPTYFGYRMVKELRGKAPLTAQELLKNLLNAENTVSFWKLVDQHRLGYLEGKVFDQVDAENFKTVVIPEELVQKLKELGLESKLADLPVIVANKGPHPWLGHNLSHLNCN